MDDAVGKSMNKPSENLMRKPKVDLEKLKMIRNTKYMLKKRLRLLDLGRK